MSTLLSHIVEAFRLGGLRASGLTYAEASSRVHVRGWRNKREWKVAGRLLGVISCEKALACFPGSWRTLRDCARNEAGVLTHVSLRNTLHAAVWQERVGLRRGDLQGRM